MKESGKNVLAAKKAYEVAYAIFRIAANIGNGFAEHMKNAATALLGSTVMGDYLEANRNLAALRYFVRFAVDVNMVGTTNGEILVREIDRLDAILAEAPMSAGLDKRQNVEIDLSDIFTEKTSEPKRQKVESGNIEYGKVQSGNDVESGNIEPGNGIENESGKTKSEEHSEEHSNGGILKAAIRQTTILERIRQIGNCRIRDIEDILPDSSERTIRYDLQTLVEQNLVERVGAGGPSVFFRIRPEGDSV